MQWMLSRLTMLMNTKPITIIFALIGLYLHLEKNFTGKEVQFAHMKLVKHRKNWPNFKLPGMGVIYRYLMLLMSRRVRIGMKLLYYGVLLFGRVIMIVIRKLLIWCSFEDTEGNISGILKPSMESMQWYQEMHKK
jgi:hypothetical protein